MLLTAAMIPLLTLPDHILLAILVKQQDKGFARLFRSNKLLQQFIEMHKTKFCIVTRRETRLDCGQEVIYLDTTYRNTIFSLKTFLLLPEHHNDVFSTFCFFKFDFLRIIVCGEREDCSKIALERFPVKVVRLVTYWDEHITEVLNVCRPKQLNIYPKKDYDVISLDLQLLADLKPDEISFTIDEGKNFSRIKYLLTNCAPFTKKLWFDLAYFLRINYTQEVLHLIYRVLDENFGRFQHLCIKRGAGFPLNFAGSLTTAMLHHDQTSDKLKLWTIPHKIGLIVCIENYYQYEEFQLNVFYARDITALQHFLDEYHSNAEKKQSGFIKKKKVVWDTEGIWNLATQENVGMPQKL